MGNAENRGHKREDRKKLPRKDTEIHGKIKSQKLLYLIIGRYETISWKLRNAIIDLNQPNDHNNQNHPNGQTT